MPSDSWFVVVNDHLGFDCIVGPFDSREQASQAWRDTIVGSRHATARATYAQPESLDYFAALGEGQEGEV